MEDVWFFIGWYTIGWFIFLTAVLMHLRNDVKALKAEMKFYREGKSLVPRTVVLEDLTCRNRKV